MCPLQIAKLITAEDTDVTTYRFKKTKNKKQNKNKNKKKVKNRKKDFFFFKIIKKSEKGI